MHWRCDANLTKGYIIQRDFCCKYNFFFGLFGNHDDMLRTTEFSYIPWGVRILVAFNQTTSWRRLFFLFNYFIFIFLMYLRTKMHKYCIHFSSFWQNKMNFYFHKTWNIRLRLNVDITAKVHRRKSLQIEVSIFNRMCFTKIFKKKNYKEKKFTNVQPLTNSYD